MSASFKWPEPSWLGEITDQSERDKALGHFHLCIAALYASPKGDFEVLASLIGMNAGTLRQQKIAGRTTPQCAVDLERLLGRSLFPRELFRPDLFTLPQE